MDNTGVVRAAGKIGDALRQAGRGLQDGIGDSLVKVAMLRFAVTQAVNAIDRSVTSVSGAAEKQAQRRLQIASAAASLPIPQSEAQRIVEHAPGITTADERAQFLVALAKQQEDKRGSRRLSDFEVRDILRRFAGGGAIQFGQGGQDLLQELERGGGYDAALRRVQRRRPGAESILRSGVAQEAIAVAGAERRTERGLADRGAAVRREMHRFDELAATDTGPTGTAARVFAALGMRELVSALSANTSVQRALTETLKGGITAPASNRTIGPAPDALRDMRPSVPPRPETHGEYAP